MEHYDRELANAKGAVTKQIIYLERSIHAQEPCNTSDLAAAIDDCNRKWDALTDCLVRQREEYAERINALIFEIAELKKGK